MICILLEVVRYQALKAVNPYKLYMFTHSLWGDHVDYEIGIEEDALGCNHKHPEDGPRLTQLEEGDQMHSLVLGLHRDL